jgi:prepilin-type N-terminal cleavage/methylation domain-containing protein
MKRLRANGGYSLIEIMVAMAVLGILAAMAVPMVAAATSGTKLRAEADNLSGQIGLAKMRASARFARTRVYVDRSASTYVVQVWNATTKSWDNDNGVTTLPFGVSFGFAKLAEPPKDTQPKIDFAQVCKETDKDSADVANTSCIMFNSRGIPIDPNGSPVGANAFYLTDGTGVRGITVTMTPLIRNWWSPADQAGWIRQ